MIKLLDKLIDWPEAILMKVTIGTTMLLRFFENLFYTTPITVGPKLSTLYYLAPAVLF